MTLPSKYRSPRSRDFRQYYFHYILVGGVAIAIFIGFLGALNKYGPEFLSGWTIENTLIFAGLSALFVLSLLISRRIFIKIIGRRWLEMTENEFNVFHYGSIGVASVIFALGLLSVMFLDILK